MASIGKQKAVSGIRYYIQLSPGEDRDRGKIRLGRITKKQAESAKTHVENLISSCKTGTVIPPATQQWLSDAPEMLLKRLEKLQLIASRNTGKQYTVAEWVGRYISKRPDVKESTRRKWHDVERKLSAFFRDEYIEDVTVQAGKDFRVYLQSVVGLSENSLRRQVGIASQFFKSAVDANLIKKNPFLGQPVSVRANESRFFYITPKMALQALNACPDTQWRLIFALARWGGLRCPSEVLRLKWEDIDFEHDRFTVHASKTEHHADSGIRTVPMFPELKPLFQNAFDEAETGDVYCISRYRSGSNLSPQMRRIIKQSGLEPWPKIFQNLRSTRETELFKLTNGNVKAVCSWIGNTPAVAMQHYAQVTEADLQEAAKMAVLNDAEKAVHDPVHTGAESSCTDSQEFNKFSDVTPYNCETNHQKTIACNSMQKAGQWAIPDSNQ